MPGVPVQQAVAHYLPARVGAGARRVASWAVFVVGWAGAREVGRPIFTSAFSELKSSTRISAK
jgi:hypothetical protein